MLPSVLGTGAKQTLKRIPSLNKTEEQILNNTIDGYSIGIDKVIEEYRNDDNK